MEIFTDVKSIRTEKWTSAISITEVFLVFLDMKNKKKLAQLMRKEPTVAEGLLWTCLRGKALGPKFRRQHVIQNRWILDFYSVKLKLGIEVDGGAHKTRKNYDAARDSKLRELGITVLRFKNEDVFDDLDRVLRAIRKAIGTLSQPT